MNKDTPGLTMVYEVLGSLYQSGRRSSLERELEYVVAEEGLEGVREEAKGEELTVRRWC